ncbi:uncharacterized protein BDZ99DRAFT_521617 [Mytilinidion resinicola]|uniref:Uncharacterized protein n=1 Tax=Mytilinidion resinicola TaxID=574789 RepID=A0A6A6YK34_9PEZI|nr:uncharacterized protein BDZ99DRAFT_521617 [Mytilinidion resinicola]KAF2809171.1 hypothetical protein BDZ99DRAFT_521617 [Mytilinidion resinicola]
MPKAVASSARSSQRSEPYSLRSRKTRWFINGEFVEATEPEDSSWEDESDEDHMMEDTEVASVKSGTQPTELDQEASDDEDNLIDNSGVEEPSREDESGGEQNLQNTTTADAELQKQLDNFLADDPDDEDMYVDAKLEGFFSLPGELRNMIHDLVAEDEAEETVTVGPLKNTVRVGMQREQYDDAHHAGYYQGPPHIPALIQTSRRLRAEYSPVWAKNTEFMLGLAFEESLEIVRAWEGDQSDLEEHTMAVRTGWAEYEFDLDPKTPVADGNLVQVVGEKIFYHEEKSDLVDGHVTAFQQIAKGLRTMKAQDLEDMIQKLLELHGNYVIPKNKTILRRHFGPW